MKKEEKLMALLEDIYNDIGEIFDFAENHDFVGDLFIEGITARILKKIREVMDYEE